MKKIILVFLCFLTLSPIIAQKVDTIYINNTSTTYLIFPFDVDLVDVGSKDYVHQIQESAKNVVFIKALKEKNASGGIPIPTSFFIKSGNEYYNGVLIFKKDIKQTMYDFRISTQKTNATKNTSNTSGSNSGNNSSVGGNNSNNNTNTIKSNNTATTQTQESGNDMQKNLLKLRDSKAQYKSIGQISNGMSIFCSNIYIDKQNNIYLKFSIKNNSSIDYELDFVEFNFIDKRSKAMQKKEPLTPLYMDEKKLFPSKKQVEFLYVLPPMAGTDNSLVEVTFREMNGTRKAVIEVPSSKINASEIIK
ncbi:MAG: conjugative transposon protein TraN [Raineya sp.]|jgi:hypothetical protein|nr:conjugative transposon protein TraN [Raineya sp.]